MKILCYLTGFTVVLISINKDGYTINGILGSVVLSFFMLVLAKFTIGDWEKMKLYQVCYLLGSLAIGILANSLIRTGNGLLMLVGFMFAIISIGCLVCVITPEN